MHELGLLYFMLKVYVRRGFFVINDIEFLVYT